MKKNYWNIYKSYVCYWEFSLDNLIEKEYLDLVLAIVEKGYESRLLIPYQNNKEVPLETVVSEISKFIKKSFETGKEHFFNKNKVIENSNIINAPIGNFFERILSEKKIEFYSEFYIHTDKKNPEIIKINSNVETLTEIYKSINLPHIKEYVFVINPLQIEIYYDVKGNVNCVVTLYSDLWLPKVTNSLIEEYLTDYPTIRKAWFDNNELALLNSHNLNILLDGLYYITEKLRGKAFFDKDASSIFLPYIKDGRVNF